MEKSKIIARLRILSEQEMKDFILFTDSPYFNSNAALTRLLKYLQKYHPDLKGTKLAKELVYRKVFPEKAVFKEKRLNDLMTQLFKLSEDFFAFDRFKKSPLIRKRHELISYREHNMKNDFDKSTTSTSVKKLLEKETQNEYCLVEKYLLEKEIVLFQSAQATKQKERQFEPVLNALDYFYFREKLIFATITKNREKTLTRSYNISLLKEISNITVNAKSEKDFNHFLVRFIEVQDSEDKVELEKLIAIYKEISSSLSLRYAQMILYIFINIFSRKFRHGNRSVVSIIFDLYDFALTENFLMINNRIDEPTFINICLSAEISNKREWLDKFIIEKQQYIFPQKNKENTVNLAWATVLFERVKKSKSVESIQEIHSILNKLKFTVPSYFYKIKSLQIKLYFSNFKLKKENADFVFLLDGCKAFENQLYRDITSNKQKVNSYLIFSRIVKRLAKYIYDDDKEKILKLINEIKNAKSIFAKKWLLNEAKEAIA